MGTMGALKALREKLLACGAKLHLRKEDLTQRKLVNCLSYSTLGSQFGEEIFPPWTSTLEIPSSQ